MVASPRSKKPLLTRETYRDQTHKKEYARSFPMNDDSSRTLESNRDGDRESSEVDGLEPDVIAEGYNNVDKTNVSNGSIVLPDMNVGDSDVLILSTKHCRPLTKCWDCN